MSALGSQVRQIDEQIERLKQQRRVLLQKAKKFGEDEWPVGTVLYFEKRFSKGSKKFLFSVLKTPTGWYSTGGHRNACYDWESLVNFMSEGVKEVWTATEWERIV